MKLVTLFFLIASASTGWSQHCPFDYAGLLVLEVRHDYTNEVRRDLTPYLTISEATDTCPSVAQAASFGGDSTFVPTPDTMRMDELSGYDLNTIKYTFAKDKYILGVSMAAANCDNLVIRFRDSDGKKLPLSYPIQPTDVVDLHQHFGHRWTLIYQNGQTPPLGEPFTQTMVVRIPGG